MAARAGDKIMLYVAGRVHVGALKMTFTTVSVDVQFLGSFAAAQITPELLSLLFVVLFSRMAANRYTYCSSRVGQKRHSSPRFAGK
jgi:hypothetical protein